MPIAAISTELAPKWPALLPVTITEPPLPGSLVPLPPKDVDEVPPLPEPLFPEGEPPVEPPLVPPEVESVVPESVVLEVAPVELVPEDPIGGAAVGSPAPTTVSQQDGETSWYVT
jgi:hypothetical protein